MFRQVWNGDHLAGLLGSRVMEDGSRALHIPEERVLKEGPLGKQGQNFKSWKQRYFVLLEAAPMQPGQAPTQALLLYFTSKEDLWLKEEASCCCGRRRRWSRRPRRPVRR